MSRVACVPVLNYFTADNRVLRTCRFLARHGFDVHVLAVGREDLPDEERLDGLTVHRFRVDRRFVPRGPIRRGLNLTAAGAYAAFIAGAVRLVRRLRPEVIHYNDWNTLCLGPFAFVRHRAVYDMHELFQDLDYLNFPRPVNQLIAGIDRVGLRHAEAVLCVSKPIADELRTLTDRPVHVVRNVPDGRFAEGNGNEERVRWLRDGRKHLVFLGVLHEETGALFMAEMLRHLPDDFVLDCFSMRTPKNAFFLEAVRRAGVEDRVAIFDYLPHSELGATVRHGWAGVSCLVPVSRKYDFALPNKLFEYFLAGLPVITSGARAQSQLVEETGFGLVVDLNDPAGSARRVAAWERPTVARAAVEQHRLTWETEEQELARAYRELGIL
jgi:glycosyltransferase involved in cell wall biosynthesis